MTAVPIPAGAIGHIGMVAMLRRVKPEALGKMVLLRQPAGFVTSLVGSSRPVFAWLALSLGDPLAINGAPSREVYVADPCLMPVSTVPEEEIQALVKAASREDFNDALQDLAKILNNTTMSPDEFERFVERAADQLGVERALQTVSTLSVLQEIGFKPIHADSELLIWTGLHEGVELRIDAGPHWFNNWHLMTTLITDRSWVCDETVLAGEDMRGRIAVVVLRMWRTAFGAAAPTPDCLSVGRIYEEHQRLMEKVANQLPRFHVDADVFRATLRWLKRRTEGCDGLIEVRLSADRGLLRMETDRLVFACPGEGNWPDTCTLVLNDLWGIPHQSLRGSVSIVHTLEGVTVNGHRVQSLLPADE